ncbi:hypothetical protein GCM10028812_33160 [Ancylobacter sonchi]
MQPGYVSATIDMLQQKYGISVTELSNISIGANNCLIGLEASHLFQEDIASYDKIVIEFIINDYKLARERSIGTWLASYEGLIRHLFLHAPDAQIYNLIFGKSENHTLGRLERLRKGVTDLVEHYGQDFNIAMVDFDAHLRGRHGANPNMFLAYYSDPGHYGRPKATERVGAYLARYMAQPAERRGSRSLPEPLSPTPFDTATMVRLPDIPNVPVRELSNSRYQRLCVPLARGESVTLDLPGPMISLSYLATRDGGALLIEEEGMEPFSIFTCHGYVINKEPGRFLIKNFVRISNDWKETPRRIRLTSIGCDEAVAMGERFTPEYSMVASPEAETTVYLSNVLCYTAVAGGENADGREADGLESDGTDNAWSDDWNSRQSAISA